MSKRQSVVKTILWAIVGVLFAVTLARFYGGLGATTGLSDSAPWGFWIAFDVMAGVALAAGGLRWRRPSTSSVWNGTGPLLAPPS